MSRTTPVEEIERSLAEGDRQPSFAPLSVDTDEIDPADDPDGTRRAAQHKHFYEKFYGTVEDRHENFMAKQQDLQCGVPILTSSQLNATSLRQMMEEEERRLALDTARAKREADEALERQQAFAATRLYEEAVRARGTRSDGAAGRPQQALATSKQHTHDITGSGPEAAKAFQRYHPVEAAKATKATVKAIASATITVQAVEESFFEQDRFRFAITDRDEDFEYAFLEERREQKKTAAGMGATKKNRCMRDGQEEKAKGAGIGSSSLLPASLLLAQLRQEMASLETPHEEETSREESSCDDNDVNKKRSVAKDSGKLRLKIPLSHPTYPTFDGDLRAQLTRHNLDHEDSHNNSDDPEMLGSEAGSYIQQMSMGIPNAKKDGAAQAEDNAYEYNRNYRVRPPEFSEPQFLSPAPTDLEHAAAVKLCRAREQLTSTSAPARLAGRRQQKVKTGQVHDEDEEEETDDEYGVVGDELSRGGRGTGPQNTSKSKKTLDEDEDNTPTAERHSGDGRRKLKLAGPSAILTTFGVGRRQTEVDLPTQLRIARHKMLGLNPSDFSQPQQRGGDAKKAHSTAEKMPPIPNRSLQYRKMLAADNSAVGGGSKLQGVGGPRRSSLAGALAAAKAAADDAEEAFFNDDEDDNKTAIGSLRVQRKPVNKVALALTEKSPSPSPRELLEGLELTEIEKKLVYGTIPPSQLSQIKRERALRDEPSLGLPQNDNSNSTYTNRGVAAAAIEDEARLLAGLAAHVLPSVPAPKAGRRDSSSSEQHLQLQQQKADLLAAEQEEAFIDKVEGMWGKRQEALVLQHTAVKSRRLAAEVDAEEALFAESSDDSDGYDEDVEKEWRSEFTSVIYGACRSLEYRPPRDEDGNVLSPATVSTNMAFYTYSNGYSYAGLASAGGATSQNAHNNKNTTSSSGSGVRAALAIRGGKEGLASITGSGGEGVSSPPAALTVLPIANTKQGSAAPANNSMSAPRNRDTVDEWFALRKEQKVAKVASVAEDGFERFVRMLKEVSAAAVAAKREELRKQSEGKLSVWREGIDKLREEMRNICGLFLPTTTTTAPHVLRSSSNLLSDKSKTNRAHPILLRPVEDIESDLFTLQQQFLQQFDLTTPPDKLPPPPPMDVFTPSEEHMVWDALRFMFRDCEPLHPKQWLSSASRLVTTLTFSDRPPIACVIYVLDAVVGLQFELDQLRVESVRERERLWGNLMLRGGKSSGGGVTAAFVSAKTKASNKVTVVANKNAKKTKRENVNGPSPTQTRGGASDHEEEDEGRLFSSDDEGGERYFASLKRISGFNARGSFSSFAAASRRRRSASRLSTSQCDGAERKGDGGSPTTSAAAAALITAQEFKKQRQHQQGSSKKTAGGRNPLFINEERISMSGDKYDDDKNEGEGNDSSPPLPFVGIAVDDPILVSSIRGASTSNMGSCTVNNENENYNTDTDEEENAFESRDSDPEEDEEEEEFRLRVEHFESFIDTITSALHPPVDTVAPHFPSCNLIRPHHLFRIERWLSRSSLLVRKRSAVLQALGVSEPTWAQLHVSAGGVDREVKVPTLTIGDAATAGVEYSHLVPVRLDR